MINVPTQHEVDGLFSELAADLLKTARDFDLSAEIAEMTAKEHRAAAAEHRRRADTLGRVFVSLPKA